MKSSGLTRMCVEPKIINGLPRFRIFIYSWLETVRVKVIHECVAAMHHFAFDESCGADLVIQTTCDQGQLCVYSSVK